MAGKRNQKGKGFFGNIGKALGSIGKFAKDTKLLSTVTGLIPHPAGKVTSTVLGQLGLGKRGRKRKTGKKSKIAKMTGRGQGGSAPRHSDLGRYNQGPNAGDSLLIR